MTRISKPTVPPAGDAELLQRFVAFRDEPSFSALVARHGPMVLGVCRRILRDPSDAEDAFQAAFLLLAMKANQVREPNLLGSWLYGAATRVALNARRAVGRRVVQEKRLMQILRPRQRDETKDADLRMMLDEQISKLPEKLRRVIVCCHLEGLTKREAAERLNINDSTIMQRLKQAREILKRRLGAHGAQLTETSLGAILVAVAVPTALAAGTAKAATVAASGKAAVAGVAAGKAAGVSKGASNVVLIAKAKLAASLLLAGGLAVTGAATAKPLVMAAPPLLPAAQVVAPPPQQAPSPASPEKQASRMRRLVLEIIMYTNRTSHSPPDLKTLHCNDPEMEYFGQGNVNPLFLRGDVAIIAERPAPDYRGPILVGFLDGRVQSLSQVQARGMIEHSRKAIQGAAASQKLTSRAPTTRHAPQVPLAADVRAALLHNAEAISPLDVSWTKTGFTPLKTPDAAKQLHVNPRYFTPIERRVVWQSGKWYDWAKGSTGMMDESVFDGASWSHVDNSKPPRLETLAANEIFGEYDVVEMGYLERAGIHLPSNGPEMEAHIATSIILAKLDAGGTLTAVGSSSSNGHPCIRLTISDDDIHKPYMRPDAPIDRTFIYDLDPAINYATRHMEQRLGQQLMETTDNDQFQQLQGISVWLPRESISRYFRDPSGSATALSEAPLGSRIEVTALKQQPVGDEQFVLKAPPPGLLADAAGAPVQKVETVAHTGVLAEVQSVSPPQLESSNLRWIVAGIAGIGAIAFAMFGIRKYRGATR